MTARDDISARSIAAQQLAAAFVRVRDQFSPTGWVLFQDPAHHDAERFLVGFSMRHGGQTVAQSTFQVGPVRAVVFETADAPLFRSNLNDLPSDGFESLLSAWAARVKAANRP